MDRYAVMGNPIAHSKSPLIHRLFAEQTGQAMSYDRLLVPLDGFVQALERFQVQGGRGLNITVPFKQDAWAAMDQRSPRAEQAGAVNTIVFRADGSRWGDNTDGIGLVRDLRDNHDTPLTGRRILLLGAGGAARGAIPAFLAESPAALVIANRTRVRAEELARLFGGDIPVGARGFDELGGERFDIIVNATSAGLGGEIPPLPPALAGEAVCYDMVYGSAPTPFVAWSRAHGARLALDGLGMLVEQAAEAFSLWRGVQPRTAPVIEALRSAA